MLRKINDNGTREIGCGCDWVIGPNQYTRKPSQQISSANEPWFWARHADVGCRTTVRVHMYKDVDNRKID
jgi:hypothetical protein